MSKQCVLKRIVFTLVLLALMGGMVSCIPTPGEEVAVAEPEPRAWIDFPRDGVGVPVGASVIVISHAYAEDGVVEVLLSVNSAAYRRDPPAASGDTLVEVRQEWVPTAPGLYTLEVRAYDGAGEVSGSDAITVNVTGDATPTELGSPTEVPEATKVPEATEVPAPTATSVPTAVLTDVPTEVPTDVSTVTPTPTPFDTTAPPVPVPYVPADGLAIECPSGSEKEQTLAWLPVDDPSGVVYYVKLEQQITATQWDSIAGWGPESGKQVEAEVQCGGIYRWTVRAEDGAGNISAWSEYSNFAIDLE